MDDMYLPDEVSSDEDPIFDKKEIETAGNGPQMAPNHPSGLAVSGYVRIAFDRFVTLVASHSFLDVVERNKNEDVVISTNLLTDLANAKRTIPSTKNLAMVLLGLLLGILLGYILFKS